MHGVCSSNTGGVCLVVVPLSVTCSTHTLPQRWGKPQPASTGLSFGPNWPCFGPNQPCFGPNQPCFGPHQPCFGPNQPCFGLNRPALDRTGTGSDHTSLLWTEPAHVRTKPAVLRTQLAQVRTELLAESSGVRRSPEPAATLSPSSGGIHGIAIMLWICHAHVPMPCAR